MRPRRLLVALALLAPCVQAADDAPNAGGRTVTVVRRRAATTRARVHRFFLGSGYREALDDAHPGPGARPGDVLGRPRGREEGRRQADEGAQARGARRARVEVPLDRQGSDARPAERAPERASREDIVQDQISASHPGNSLVVDALARAAGHPGGAAPLVVLPDDARLGEFRKEFAGMLGTLEEDPRTKAPVTPGLRALLRPAWRRTSSGSSWTTDPREQIDAPGLRARAALRPRDRRLRPAQATSGTRAQDRDDRPLGGGAEGPRPRVRELRRAGALRWSARRRPRLVKFEEGFPSIFGLTWQARFVDRRYLSGLDVARVGAGGGATCSRRSPTR